ncbi:hypothetical protein M408DRAFT_74676 [Serendipita vermifera MAFF 305830]|uniref:Uncharacterized protein n=1 Tax=Serendipita vermifera MAFF 305830 TaxID=933852 RepID=A0A0C3AKZ9_SERVB|nr:hypothetical protein M408DRAFT_74676 [Serendipita vermifera MAFF 305830]
MISIQFLTRVRRAPGWTPSNFLVLRATRTASFKASKEQKGSNKQKGSKEQRGSNEQKGPKVQRGSNEQKGSKLQRESKEQNVSKEKRGSKVQKASKVQRGSNEQRASKVQRASKEKRASKEQKASKEQNAVVEALRNGHNVIVAARPGSGKTTTAKFVAKDNQQTPTLLLTYSKKLQEETKKKMSPYPWVHVYTFHAFAFKLFGVRVKDDEGLRVLRAMNKQPSLKLTYEIIILDEIQDMTEILYWLTCKLLERSRRLLPNPPKLLVLGDSRQSIYRYNNADQRYLEMAEALFSKYSPYPWNTIDLPKSQRLSSETASFVNAFIGEPYIEGLHHGHLPIYIRVNEWKVESILQVILPIIRKFSAKNVAILAPSVRRNFPLARLTNSLTKDHGIRVAQPVSDEAPLVPKVLRHKLVVSTFHQFKGSERDVIIVYGADASYFTYIDKAIAQNSCPNAVFVAITRAKRQLVMIHNDSQPAMPFVDWSKLMSTCRYMNLTDKELIPQVRPPRLAHYELSLPKKPLSTTLVTRHLLEEELEQLIKKYVKINKVAAPSFKIKMPNAVATGFGLYESVSDINGTAVTAALEQQLRGRCSMASAEEQASLTLATSIGQFPSTLLTKIAMNHCSHPYTSRRSQMNDSSYNWLEKHLKKAVARLSQQFKRSALLDFEVDVSYQDTGEGVACASELVKISQLQGRVDMVEYAAAGRDPPTIWEIKAVSDLSFEHVAQIVIYGMLWYIRNKNSSESVSKFPHLVLFNVRNGAKWIISTTFDEAKAFTDEVIRLKYTGKPPIPTEVFLKRCRQVRESVATKKQK